MVFYNDQAYYKVVKIKRFGSSLTSNMKSRYTNKPLLKSDAMFSVLDDVRVTKFIVICIYIYVFNNRFKKHAYLFTITLKSVDQQTII